jgi:glycosyltransferase involved in cell wall biosynthesis
VKILHVVHSLDAGGMENGIVNIARGLEPNGVTTHVACLDRRGRFAERLPVPENVTVLGKRHGFSPPAVWRLSRLLSQLQPDIVHSHNLGALIYSALAMLGHRKATLIQGEHSHLTSDERRPYRLRQRRWLFRRCRAIHTVSNAMREELVACGLPAEKISAIANGVDTKHFTPADRSQACLALGLPAEARCIGIVGRFGPFKRHWQLLEAFESIASQFADLHLLIVGGGGSEEAAVTERAQASIFRERIHLLGFQNDPRRCYRALDLLAIPSANEGLSNVALEAMACAVPILGRIDCGHEQVVTSGIDGWISSLESTEKLATELARILSDPQALSDFGARARIKVEQHFSLASMVAAYDRLYRTAAPCRR